MNKVVHLIPRDGIGGVEVAARSMVGDLQYTCDFKLVFIAGKSLIENKRVISASDFRSENNVFAHIVALKNIRLINPDILVCSLWRSVPVGLLIKLFSPNTKLVFFLHLASTTHLFDRWLSQIMVMFCDAVWGDSKTTISSRLGSNKDVVKRVISFVISRNPNNKCINTVAPNFVFWGRLHHQKGLDRCLNFIKMLLDRGCPASYEIWGPDDGEKSKLEASINALGLTNAVGIMGQTDQRELNSIAKKNSFYLQLSYDEGMAMSVVEAMQRSLVPVVTPVGEVAEYCQQGKNAVVVTDPENLSSAVDEVLSLIKNKPKYRELQKSAYSYWSHHSLYKDDFCKAANELFN